MTSRETQPAPAVIGGVTKRLLFDRKPRSAPCGETLLPTRIALPGEQQERQDYTAAH